MLPWSKENAFEDVKKSLVFDNNILTIRLLPNSGKEMLEKTFSQKEGFPFSAVVMSALGTGNPPAWTLSLIESLIKRNIPVVIVPPETGMSTKLIYESARQASELGAIQSGDMISPAATVKLSYLLGNPKTKSLEQLKKLFVKNYYGELS